MIRRIMVASLLVIATGSVTRGDVANSKHNLSASGTGTIVASSEDRICIFCHTPHNANPVVPLWNHEMSTVGSYATYSSTTLTVATPLSQPTGASKLCLSCHDGTVALGQTINDGLIVLQNTGPGGRMPLTWSNLGTDLTDDHPISFVPNPTNIETMDPPPGDPVSLDNTGQVQCTSCHDPHIEDIDSVSRRFLVKENRASAICLTCHAPEYWSTNPSSHESSSATYTVVHGGHTGYETVADNGCEGCHRPHSGSAPDRNLKFLEEATCYQCHQGPVSSTNVSADFLQKPYTHPTYAVTPSVHDAAESPLNPSNTLPETNPVAQRHAECSDCHNPHAAFEQPATAPAVTGVLSGTWGIDSAGNERDPALSQYEICYKCHADSANKPQESGLPSPPYVQRQLVQFNTRLEFDPLNPSHHAVEGPGQNPDVPSLLPPYTTASIIYCTDCHNSNTSPAAGGTGANGPHGSLFNHILERRLVVGSNNGGTNFGTMYALCFKCHSETSILADESFRSHRKHIEGEGTSCVVCHDPHGVSATQGNAIENSNLINFDTSIVLPRTTGELRFEDRGRFTGSCWLVCHGEDHNDEGY